MLGSCKHCEYGCHIDNWCEKKKQPYKKKNEKCDDYLEASYISDADYYYQGDIDDVE